GLRCCDRRNRVDDVLEIARYSCCRHHWRSAQYWRRDWLRGTGRYPVVIHGIRRLRLCLSRRRSHRLTRDWHWIALPLIVATQFRRPGARIRLLPLLVRGTGTRSGLVILGSVVAPGVRSP